jgi:hypothetical protein
LIIQGISALFVACGLFYAGNQLRLARKVHQDNHEWNRRNVAQQATIDYASKITGAEKLNKALTYSVAKEPIPLDTILAAFDKDEGLRTITHRLLNYNESLAIGVLQGVYDEWTIKAIRKSPMILLFESFKNYVNKVRCDFQPTAWEQQEKLINKWKHDDNPPQYREQTGTSR